MMTVIKNNNEKPLMRLINLAVSNAHALIALLMLIGYGGILFLPMFEQPVKFGEKSLIVGGAHAGFRYEVLESGMGRSIMAADS